MDITEMLAENELAMRQLLLGTGWTWSDPTWAYLGESDLICPCGNRLEIDAKACYCGRKNPIRGMGLI